MSDNHLKSLLMIVQNNEDTAILLKQGLTYVQISKLINNAIADGSIEETANFELALTRKGLEIIEGMCKHRPSSKQAEWIRPDEKYKVDKIGVDDIYLPTIEESKLLM